MKLLFSFAIVCVLNISAGGFKPRSNEPLHHATECNNIPLMRELLEKPGAQVNEYDQLGFTPLHHVKSLAAAQLLVKHDACLITPLQHYAGHTPLHMLVQHDTPERRKIVLFFLENFAPINMANIYDSLPLDLVDWQANPIKMVKLLLEHRAPIRPFFNGVPGHLDQAIYYGCSQLAALLLHYGADPEAISFDSELMIQGLYDRQEIATLIQQARNK